MPHITVKLWPGSTAQQRQDLSDAILRKACEKLGSGEQSISIAFEEVAPQDWTKEVFEPDILGKWAMLTKQPGYGPKPD